MASIKKTFYYNSSMLERANITKSYVANEEEIEAIIEFENMLRKRLDSFRPEDVIRSDSELANRELSHAKKFTHKYNFYTKVIQKNEDELKEISALKRLINNQKNIDIIYLLYYIQFFKIKDDVVKAFIKTGKLIDNLNTFYQYFDNHGNVIESNIIELDNLLIKLMKTLDVRGDKNEIFRNIARLFYTKKQYDDAVEERIKMEKLAQDERDAKDKERRRQYEAEEQIRRKELSEKQAKASQFLDIKGRLNQYAVNYPLEVVLESISREKGNIDLTNYEYQYYDMLTEKEINTLLVLKTSKEEQEKLQTIIDDIRLLRKARDIILSEDYQTLSSNEEKKNLLLEELLEEEKEEVLVNQINESRAIFLFPFTEFLRTEIAQNTSKINVAYEQIINQIRTKFLSLRNNSLIEMRSHNNALVHRILNASNDGFKLCGDLEAYRFGHRINKLCYVSIPMPDINRQMLKERYSLSDDFKVYAILGFGNVRLENETLFYDRIVRNAKKLESYYQLIYDVFSKPFTEATFETACNYIENGSEQIKELLDIEYIKSAKSKRNT